MEEIPSQGKFTQYWYPYLEAYIIRAEMTLMVMKWILNIISILPGKIVCVFVCVFGYCLENLGFVLFKNKQGSTW